jgi:hypothetical protein
VSGSSLVLLLLPSVLVPRRFSPTIFALGFFLIGLLSGAPAGAAQRTFVLAPADLVPAPDLFSAKVLSRSALLGKTIGLKRGAVRFAKGVCPSLLADPTRKLTRIRILGGPTAAPLVVGKSLEKGLASALAMMDAKIWLPPAAGKTRQPSWVAEPPTVDAVIFTTAGFATGDQTGALGKADAGNAIPGFRAVVEVPDTMDPGIGSIDFAVAVTTELPPKKLGKPGKRTECIMVASLVPVDLEAIRDLVNAAPLTDVTRHRLLFILDTAQAFLDRGHPDRAARNVRSFALEVSQRTETEIAPAFAEPMINRANATAEALDF